MVSRRGRVVMLLVLALVARESADAGSQAIESLAEPAHAAGRLPGDIAATTVLLRAEDERFAGEAVMALTAASDAGLRARAALTLGRVGTPPVVPRLLELMRDPDPTTRAMAAFAIGRVEYDLWPSVADAYRTRARDALLSALKDEWLVAEQAAWSLGAVDSGVAGAVRERLAAQASADSVPAVTAALVDAWWRLEGADLIPLRALVASPHAEVRRSVAHAIRRLEDPNGMPLLEPLLRDADADVRLAAVRAARIAPVSVAERFATSLLGDRDWRVQCETLVWIRSAWSISQVEPSEALFPAVLRRSLDRNLHVRRCALDALGAVIDQRGVAADRLLEALGEEDSAVRTDALRVLLDSRVAARALDVARARLGGPPDGAVLADHAAQHPAEATLLAKAMLGSDDAAAQALVAAGAEISSLIANVVVAERQAADPAGALATAIDALSSGFEIAAAEQVADSYRALAPSLTQEQRTTLVETLWRYYYDGRESAPEADRLVALNALAAVDADVLARRASLLFTEPSRLLRARALDLVRGEAVSFVPWETDLAAPHRPLPGDDEYRRLAERVRDLQQQRPQVEIETERGVVVIELLPAWAPRSVIRFLDLVERGAYEGSPFHRVIAGFVSQGGALDDDASVGWMRNEDSPLAYRRGTVGWALAGRDTVGSQFFITHAAQAHLTGAYPVFAVVVAGQRVLERVQPGDRMSVRRLIAE